MTFINLILTFENRDWLAPVSDFFMGAGALSVEIRGKSPTLTVLARDGKHADELLQRCLAFGELMGFETADIERETLTDTDWIAAFRAHFESFHMTPDLKVMPEWDAGEQDRRAQDTIVVDPGQAFGTGLHPTTALAADFLLNVMKETDSRTVMDVGCGSGILSVIASKNGAASVLAFDIDPLCSHAVQHHALLNNLMSGQIRMFVGTHRSLNVKHPADVVVINIIESVIRAVLPEIRHLVGGTLILSGVLQSDAPAFIAWLRDMGFNTINQTVREEWAAFQCEPV